MNTGELIKKYRHIAKLSQSTLGERLGISQQQIAQYESGKRTPKLETLRKIAEVLCIPVEYLFEPINIGIMTDNDFEKINYLLSNAEKDIQSIFLHNGYSLTKQGDDDYIIQKIIAGIHGKKIKLTQHEYQELTSDIDFFIKYLVEKLFTNHDNHFAPPK